MTRSSTPSKRPASSSAPGPAASSRRERLGQRLTARRQVDQRGIGFLDACVVDGGGEHVGAHHHAGAAAGRRVIDRAMAAKAELADRYRAQRPQAGFQRLPTSETPSGPGNISGNSVSTVARQGGRSPLIGKCGMGRPYSGAAPPPRLQTPSTTTMCSVPAPCRDFLASAYSGELA